MNGLTILPIDPRTADDRTMLAIADLNNREHQLIQPEDPDISSASLAQIYRSVPTSNAVCDWVAWDGGALAGLAFAFFDQEAREDPSMFCKILVDPNYRRQGLGRALLRKIYDYARENGRTVLNCALIDRETAGNAFMERIGGKAGLVGRFNQLDLRDLDRGLIRHWVEQGQQRAPGFEVGIWENHYPEADLPGLVEVAAEMHNTAPHDALEVAAADVTPEDLRQTQRVFQEMGICLWTAYARDAAAERVVGISEVNWHAEQPAILNQMGTVVLRPYRGRGIGRWLKAAVLEKVLRDLPGVCWVRTHNANSNAPMLKINEALGFKPYIATINWQVSVERVGNYLSEMRAGGSAL